MRILSWSSCGPGPLSDLAAQYLVAPGLSEAERMWPAAVLRRLADPAASPALVRAYEEAEGARLRLELLEAIDAAGAPGAPALLADAARGADPEVGAWARERLAD